MKLMQSMGRERGFVVSPLLRCCLIRWLESFLDFLSCCATGGFFVLSIFEALDVYIKAKS